MCANLSAPFSSALQFELAQKTSQIPSQPLPSTLQQIYGEGTFEDVSWKCGGRKTFSPCLHSARPRLSDGGRRRGTCVEKCTQTTLDSGRRRSPEVRGQGEWAEDGGSARRAEDEHLRRGVMLPDAAEGRCVYTTRPAGGREQESRCQNTNSSSSSSSSSLPSLLSAGPDPPPPWAWPCTGGRL